MSGARVVAGASAFAGALEGRRSPEASSPSRIAGTRIRDGVGLDLSSKVGRFGFAASPVSTLRGGRVTAPVGRVSVDPIVPSVGGATRGSRPLKMRVRRNSSSSGAPGVRVLAPVVRSGTLTTGVAPGGRATAGRSARSVVETSPVPVAGRAGKPLVSGSLFNARRASNSFARCGLTFWSSRARAGTEVTALK